MNFEAWSACELIGKRKKYISHYGPLYIIFYRVNKNNKNIGKNKLESAS